MGKKKKAKKKKPAKKAKKGKKKKKGKKSKKINDFGFTSHLSFCDALRFKSLRIRPCILAFVFYLRVDCSTFTCTYCTIRICIDVHYDVFFFLCLKMLHVFWNILNLILHLVYLQV